MLYYKEPSLSHREERPRFACTKERRRQETRDRRYQETAQVSRDRDTSFRRGRTHHNDRRHERDDRRRQGEEYGEEEAKGAQSTMASPPVGRVTAASPLPYLVLPSATRPAGTMSLPPAGRVTAASPPQPTMVPRPLPYLVASPPVGRVTAASPLPYLVLPPAARPVARSAARSVSPPAARPVAPPAGRVTAASPSAARPVAMSAARSASPPAARPVAIPAPPPAAYSVAKAPPAPKPSSCRKCKAPFASRNALFEHLRGACPGQQKTPAAVATVPAPAVDDDFGCPTAAVVATIPAPAADDGFGCPTVPQPAGSPVSSLENVSSGFSAQGLSAVIEAVCATVLAAVVRRLAASPAENVSQELSAVDAGCTTVLAAAPTNSPQQLLQAAGSQQRLQPPGNSSPQQLQAADKGVIRLVRYLHPAANPPPPAAIFKPGRDMFRLIAAARKTVRAAASPAVDAFGKSSPQQLLLSAGNLPPQRCF